MLIFNDFLAAGYEALVDGEEGVMLCKWVLGTHLDRSTFQRYQIVVKIDGYPFRFFPEATLLSRVGPSMKVSLNTNTEVDTVASIEAFYADVYERLDCAPISG